VRDLLDALDVLKKIDNLERDLAKLKKDVLHELTTKMKDRKDIKTSLFGSVKAGDITEEMIEESKRNLFRNFK